MALSTETIGEHIAGLATGLGRLRERIEAMAEQGAAQVTTALRAELRRSATTLMFAVLTVVCATASLALATVAVMFAAWQNFRILAAALLALFFALLTLIFGLGVRSMTRPARPAAAPSPR
jgi:uncharacterized membrane protein YqjE